MLPIVSYSKPARPVSKMDTETVKENKKQIRQNNHLGDNPHSHRHGERGREGDET